MSITSRHILIIEDEFVIAETLMYACKEENIATTHQLLGHEAISLVEKQAFDFVILDVGLPDMTGFDVCKKIREISDVPILFLTARNHEIDRILGLEIGADDYVTKPFSPREVVARIKATLRRIEQLGNLPSHHKSFSPFHIDEAGCRVQYYDHWLNLTRYEYLLLKTLLSQPRRVFSRAHLMDIVWKDAEETLERTVDAHVKTLRAKLREINPNSEVILTHRSMGYSLEDNN